MHVYTVKHCTAVKQEQGGYTPELNDSQDKPRLKNTEGHGLTSGEKRQGTQTDMPIFSYSALQGSDGQTGTQTHNAHTMNAGRGTHTHTLTHTVTVGQGGQPDASTPGEETSIHPVPKVFKMDVCYLDILQAS